MTGNQIPERAEQRQQGGNYRDTPPLQSSRRTHADQLPHEQAEIEASCVEQQPFPNVAVPAEVHATHPAGLIEMGKGSFQALAAQP